MCDCVVAVGDETLDGVTLFGKNSDRVAGEPQPLLQFSEAAHPPGASVACTHIEIPQVAETYRVLGHSPWWVWGFEQGVNEFAVAIGNHSVFSREPLEDEPGLIGMDLVRLGLERSRDAREAVEVIAELIERYGQGGAALGPDGAGYHNSFLIADPMEAWRLETSNRHWVARRTRLCGMSNHYELGDDWEIASRETERFARGQNWWPEEARIDFSAAYRNHAVPKQLSSGRVRRSLELLEKGRGSHAVGSFLALLRDHEGSVEGPPPEGVTPDDERFFTLCAHSDPVFSTTASLVAPLPGDRVVPWPVWVCFGSPCTGVYLPVYLEGVIPAELARAGESPEADSLWWGARRLQDRIAADAVGFTPRVQRAWSEFSTELERDRVAVEVDARRLALEDRCDEAGRVLSRFMEHWAVRALKRMEDLVQELA